jgi:hypothetical protein
MSEAVKYVYTHKELAAALVKQQGLHEGVWAIIVEFGLAAVNAGQAEDELNPTAIIPVQKIGIMKTGKLNSLAVDAAVVNPKKGKAKTAQKK